MSRGGSAAPLRLARGMVICQQGLRLGLQPKCSWELEKMPRTGLKRQEAARPGSGEGSVPPQSQRIPLS